MERGGWNGPRKHGEGGNTPAERGLAKSMVQRARRLTVTTTTTTKTMTGCDGGVVVVVLSSGGSSGGGGGGSSVGLAGHRMMDTTCFSLVSAPARAPGAFAFILPR
ncbi:hypothetical protein M0802_007994 [Mischocyttarus mexicanus]|nr:hypothetical protein M0802_007994 [Mischocyttarus mexicanus]